MEIDFQSVSVITDKSFPVIDNGIINTQSDARLSINNIRIKMSEYETVVISIIDEKKGENS